MQKLKRLLALILMTVFTLTQLPLTALGNDTLDEGSEIITGTVTAFENLPDEIRWQNTPEPTFPITVGGMVEGEAAQIPVTWQTEQEYDENAPQPGLYVFSAVPGEGYTLAGGVERPLITIYIPESSFTLFRMGGGTEVSPLELTTEAQLAEIATLVNEGRLENFLFNDSTATVYLKLESDLQLFAYGANWNGGKGWKPIGTATNPFKGHFDGNGKTITGLYINDTTLNYAGLFGYAISGSISKLLLKDVSITANDYVGALVGSTAQSQVSSCLVSGTVSGVLGVGGIAGSVQGELTHCASTTKVMGISIYIGGLVGEIIAPGTVDSSYASGEVSGNGLVGGLVGYSMGSISSSVALNLKISGNSDVARIFGFGESNNSNNLAFDGVMDGSGNPFSSGSASDNNGEDITATGMKADGTLGGRFTTSNGWTVENGKLPGFGAAVDMPAHITDDPYFFGEGTAANPFRIDTADQLALLAELVNAQNFSYNDKHYKLTTNLDLSIYGASNTDFNGGKGWIPIGNYLVPFYGYFDGGGNTITGLYINDSNLDDAGLLGAVESAVVENLGLVDVNITAKQCVGGVVGSSSLSVVRSCYVTGSVSGNSSVGGVVGDSGYVVQNCYTTADVSGIYFAGGVAGSLYGTMQGCFSTGSISGEAVGGMAGYMNAGTVEDCAALNHKIVSINGSGYAGRVVGLKVKEAQFSLNLGFEWILDGSGGQLSSVDDPEGIQGANISADALQQVANLPAVFQSDPWTCADGSLPGLFGKTVEMPDHITERLTSPSAFAGGDGSEGNPYQISTAAQLAKLAELVNAGDSSYNSKYYQLTSDLDLSGYGKNYNGGKGWISIGTKTNKFQGHFDGNYKTITGLYIHNDWDDYSANGSCGLFGSIAGGSVQKLLLYNANVHGIAQIGVVAGEIENASVQACGVSGTVRGTAAGGANVGAVVGFIGQNGKVENCYSSGSISGDEYSANIGGIAGVLEDNSSLVQNCYSVAEVKGSGNVGGIAGALWFRGTIKNCAALNPSVSAPYGSSRVVVENYLGDLAKNYAFSDMKVNNEVISDGLADNIQGADIIVSQIYAASFWTTAENWDADGWNTSVWTFENDKLPILSGFAPGAQSGEGGLYLMVRDMAYATVDAGGSYIYTGSLIEPSLAVTFNGVTLTKDKDYSVSITSIDGSGTSAGTNIGTVTLTLTGMSNFTGTKTATYTIQKALDSAMVSEVSGTFTYNGGVHTPTVTVADGSKTLLLDTDYTVAYTNNTPAGSASVIITGKGLYYGEVLRSFTIEKRPVTVKAEDKTMTRGGSLPTFTYTLEGQLSGETALVGTPALLSPTAKTNETGSYPIEVDLSGISYTANYRAANPGFVNGTLTVNPSSSDTGSGGGTSTPVEAPKDSSAVETVISKEALDKALEAGTEALTVSTPIASIAFSTKALSTLLEEITGDLKLSASRIDAASLSAEAQQLVGDRPVFDFRVTSGDKTISQFGGNVSVSVPYTPKAGEDINAIVIYYINAEGKLEVVSNCVYDPLTGTLSFTTDHFSKYAVGYNKVNFKDVPASAWYSKAVTFIAAREVTTGTGEGNFSPEAKLTRGQFMVMLMKAYAIAPDQEAKDNFADAGDTYYTGYLAAAKRLGLSAGVGSNLFAPDKAITRQEMFTLLYNTLKVIGGLPQGSAGKPLSSFSDAGDIAPWAKEAMNFLVEAGVISGNDGKLTPTSTTTRAEMAQVLYNLISKY